MDFSKPKVLIDLDEYEFLKAGISTEAAETPAQVQQSKLAVYEMVLGTVVNALDPKSLQALYELLHKVDFEGTFTTGKQGLPRFIIEPGIRQELVPAG